MGDCVAEGNCKVELGSDSKIEAFDLAINACDRFEIAGLDESGTKFVLRDTEKQEGEHGVYTEIDVQEVVDKPLKDILAVVKDDRNSIVLNGISRIVGYYSRVNNWNNSKLSELADRHKGSYGSDGFVSKHKDESKDVVSSMRVAYGT